MVATKLEDMCPSFALRYLGDSPPAHAELLRKSDALFTILTTLTDGPHIFFRQLGIAYTFTACYPLGMRDRAIALRMGMPSMTCSPCKTARHHGMSCVGFVGSKFQMGRIDAQPIGNVSSCAMHIARMAYQHITRQLSVCQEVRGAMRQTYAFATVGCDAIPAISVRTRRGRPKPTPVRSIKGNFHPKAGQHARNIVNVGKFHKRCSPCAEALLLRDAPRGWHRGSLKKGSRPDRGLASLSTFSLAHSGDTHGR